MSDNTRDNDLHIELQRRLNALRLPTDPCVLLSPVMVGTMARELAATVATLENNFTAMPKEIPNGG